MYRYRFTRFSVCMLFAVCTLLLSSCGTRAPRVDYRELARAALCDWKWTSMPTTIIVSTWKWPTGLAYPTATEGTTHRGTDCSGFTSAVYKKVYHKKL